MANFKILSQEEIASIQACQLHQTIDYIYQRSPYYRDLMDREGLKPSHIQVPADLKYFPTTTKDDLSQAEDRFLCVRPEEVIDIMTTSGTTGTPIFIKATAYDMNRLAYNEALSFASAGITSRDVVALAVAMDRCFMAGIAYYSGLTRLGATVLRVGPTAPAMLLRFLERAGVNVIVSVPSFLKRIAAYAQQEGIPLQSGQMKKLICIGEPVRHRDFSLNPLGSMIAEAWGAQVYSTYATTEIATTFCECSEGCGGHLHPDLIHVEIINPQGEALPDGEVGEICVTPYGLKGMPLVRYRTGDFSFIQRNPCACGRYTLRLGPILGRRDQMLKIKGTTIFPAVIHEIVQAEPAVRAYVLVVESEDVLSDKITLLIDTDQANLGERLGEKIRSEIKILLQVKVVSGEEIQSLQTAGEYRKRRLFIDRRQAK